MNPKSLHAIARHRSVFAISRNRLSFKMRPTCRSRSRHARSRETHPIVPTHHLGTLDHPVGFNTSGALVCSCSAAFKGKQQFLLHSMWNCPDNASRDNRKHPNQRGIVASPDALLPEQRSLTR
jgi:hypothetical protein